MSVNLMLKNSVIFTDNFLKQKIWKITISNTVMGHSQP